MLFVKLKLVFMELKVNFSEFIPIENVILDLKGNDKVAIIKELLTHMLKLNLIEDYESALKEILQRENHLSTGLEYGIAIPHSKIDGVKKLSIVFGIKRKGVDFESQDAQPAYLIFLVVSPKNTSGPHIQALAMISRNLKERSVRDRLKKASTPDEIAVIFETFN